MPVSRNIATTDSRYSGAAEYVVKQSLTTSATAVSNAIDTMSAAGGGDTPEAHNLVFRNSRSPATGGAIGWASNTTKVLVVISDAEPHGARNATTSCDDLSPDPHAFATASELASMQANGRILFMVRAAATASTSHACYQGLAAQAAASSQGVDLGTNLGNQLVALVTAPRRSSTTSTSASSAPPPPRRTRAG